MLDLEKHLHIVRNLIPKLRAVEKVCGAGLIHDTRGHLSILVNWERNLEYYIRSGKDVALVDWETNSVTSHTKTFTPDQEYLDKYFGSIYKRCEKWLIHCSTIMSRMDKDTLDR